jgi:hypothetical protein
MLSHLDTLMHLDYHMRSAMYQSVLEYLVNADLFYRLWMAAEMQDPVGTGGSTIMHPRTEWLPEVVNGTFEDVRLVPSAIRVTGNKHRLNSDLQFHTGNTTPTIKVNRMELLWGTITEKTPNGIHLNKMRAAGPCHITLSGLQMWHHNDIVHRRRGDAVLCDTAIFEWNMNTRGGKNKSFRSNGPFQVVISKFRAAFNKGVAVDVSYNHCNVSWSTEDGARLGEHRVQGIINKNDIKVDYLMADDAFEDSGEGLIFWDEIGRAKAATGYSL